MNSTSRLQYSRIQQHNKYPTTDALYDPLRKILLRPDELVVTKDKLNPAASNSRLTRDFAYLTENQVKQLRQQTLIPVDQPLIATNNFEKVRNTRFVVVDARESVLGPPISLQQMQRIRTQGFKEEKVLYDFQEEKIESPVGNLPPSDKLIVKPPTITQTKILKQELKTTYRAQEIQQYKSKQKDKYKYNLFSMLDQQVNGGGCGCPSNQIIASRNQPQSINWLN